MHSGIVTLLALTAAPHVIQALSCYKQTDQGNLAPDGPPTYGTCTGGETFCSLTIDISVSPRNYVRACASSCTNGTVGNIYTECCSDNTIGCNGRGPRSCYNGVDVQVVPGVTPECTTGVWCKLVYDPTAANTHTRTCDDSCVASEVDGVITTCCAGGVCNNQQYTTTTTSTTTTTAEVIGGATLPTTAFAAVVCSAVMAVLII